MYTFGYEFRPWQDVKVLADGPSIQPVHRRHRSRIRNRRQDPLRPQECSTAEWSSPESRWTVTARHETTEQTRTYTCRYLISCTGYYNHDAGYLPTFPGADRFTGTIVHPQLWPEDLDYTGKKVVVIGSGATAVTLIPAMADDVEHITMLQRSPSYIFTLPAVDKISRIPRSLPSREMGVRTGAQTEHRGPAPAVPGLPPLAREDAPHPALAGSRNRSGRRST